MHSFSKNIGQQTKEHQYQENIKNYKNFVYKYFNDEKYAKKFSSVGVFWEARFHEQMLNPKFGIIDLGKKNYIMLPQFMRLLNDYFRLGDNEDGSYISVDAIVNLKGIDFTGTNLSYKDDNQTNNISNSALHLYSFLADFIRKNPAIETLILSNTKLTDQGAQEIADALENNTRLTSINLENNPDIKSETVARITALIEKNVNRISHIDVTP